MASSYSTDLKLELMVTGENAGQWGDKTNTNLNLVQQAVAGVEAITLSSGTTTTLVMSNGALSNARNMVLKIATITLGGATVLAIPDGIEKFYIVDCTGVTNPTNLTIKTVSGTGFALTEAAIVAGYSDGTNFKEISLNTLGGTIATAQIEDLAVTAAKISANAVITAKIADNAVLSAKISANQIVTAKLADDAVTAAKLSDTAVTAGSYTLASITVDAQGRLTAASTGTSPQPLTEFFYFQGAGGGSTLNNHGNTIGSGATLHIYAQGGAGGGGGNQGQSGNPGGNGGAGQICYFTTTLAGAYTASTYSIGAMGNGGSGGPNPGQNGGDTVFTNFLTAPGGNGGSGGNRGPQSGGGGSTGGQSLPTTNPAATINFAPFAPTNSFASPLGADGTLTNTLTLSANQKIAGSSTGSVFTVPGNSRTFGLNTGGIGSPPGVESGNAATGESFLGILVE